MVTSMWAARATSAARPRSTSHIRAGRQLWRLRLSTSGVVPLGAHAAYQARPSTRSFFSLHELTQSCIHSYFPMVLLSNAIDSNVQRLGTGWAWFSGHTPVYFWPQSVEQRSSLVCFRQMGMLVWIQEILLAESLAGGRRQSGPPGWQHPAAFGMWEVGGWAGPCLCTG